MATHALTAEQTFAMASALHAAGRLGESERLYNAVLQLRPDWAEAHNDLGVVLAALGRQAEAAPHFERARALAPDFAAASTNLANALSALERYDEAIAIF